MSKSALTTEPALSRASGAGKGELATLLFRAMLVFAALTAPSTGQSQGVFIPRGCEPRPRPIPLPQPAVRPEILPCRIGAEIVRTRTDVRVRMTDRVLRYEVEERFVNRGNTVGEADYVFPLPKNAAFQDLQLEINGEFVSGETFGADEARRMYEEIVRKQRDPALVEWMGYGMLRTRIFPIAPGEEKRVVVRFQAVAMREGDALRVDYFGGTRGDQARGAGQQTGRVKLTLQYPDRGFGRAYSPTHELDVNDRGSEIDVEVRGDARDATILVPVPRTDAAAISVLTNAPGRENGFAMVTVTPPDRGRATSVTPRDITLVLDVSGSMSGAKMKQARAAGHQLLETLRPEDRFRLIDFATDVHSFRDQFVNATPENLRAARRYLDDLDANGSTNIESALREAMRGDVQDGRLPLVLFVTDGEPTVGERDPMRLADIARPRGGSSRGAQVRVYTFGLGADVNVSLLEQLAIEGRGTSQFVRPEESVERTVALVASRLVDPVLTDVRVRVSGNVSLTKMQPVAGSDLFAGQDLVVFARYDGSGTARVVVEGRQNGRPIEWTTTASFPDRAPENAFVARLWASQRIGYLSAERRRNGGSPELDQEIRTLGERFSIPTEFTSYFVKEPNLQMAAGGVAPPSIGSGVGNQTRTMGASKGSVQSASAPAAARDAQFEAAKMSAAQRVSTSSVALDSMRQSRRRELGDDAANERSVGSRVFRLTDNVWTDVRPAGKTREVIVKAYSKAYFELLKQLPELSSIVGIGEQVTVVGRGVVVSVRTGNGVESMTDAEIKRVVQDW